MRSILTLGTAVLLLGALVAQDEPTAPEEVDPKKEAPKLCRVLERGNAEERRAALQKLISFGDVAKSRTRSTLRRMKSNWEREFRKRRTSAHSKIRAGRDMPKIAKLRKECRDLLKEKKPDQMKPKAQELMKQFWPDMSVAGNDPKVKEAEARLHEVEGMLGQIGEKTEDVAAKLTKMGGDLDERAYYSLMPGNDARTVMRNRQLSKQIQENEYDFVKLLNRYRISMGVNAAEIDVKLCKAARGHSKDMKEKGFFSHDSPVPGKRTMGMRAAKEGTSCASENIARSGPRGEDAFWSWFSSKAGHHDNMLARWRRVGIGNFAEMWTGNFG
jgi:hypothetical protein